MFYIFHIDYSILNIILYADVMEQLLYCNLA